MFDLETIKTTVVEKLRRLSDNAAAGDLRFARGAVARYLTLREAHNAVAQGVREAFTFEPGSISSYLRHYPEVLNEVVHGGRLGDAFCSAVRRCIANDLAAEAAAIVFQIHDGKTVNDLFDDVDATAEEALKYVPQFGFQHQYTLRSHLSEAKENPSHYNMDCLREELETQAKQMRELVLNLDIADPPTAAYCARIGRRFEEAASHIEIVLEYGDLETFTESWKARRRTA